MTAPLRNIDGSLSQNLVLLSLGRFYGSWWHGAWFHQHRVTAACL